MDLFRTAGLLTIALAALPAAGAAQRYGGMPAPATREEVRPEPDRRGGSYRRHHRPPARYIVLNDGSIIADLGYGYEQVIRSCSVTGSQRQSWVTHPAPAPARPAGASPTQPVPGWQPAPGQQPAPGAPAQGSQQWSPPRYEPPPQITPRQAAPPRAPVVTSRPTPCWVTDGYGNIFIVNR
jgi:hypothetical protein